MVHANLILYIKAGDISHGLTDEAVDKLVTGWTRFFDGATYVGPGTGGVEQRIKDFHHLTGQLVDSGIWQELSEDMQISLSAYHERDHATRDYAETHALGDIKKLLSMTNEALNKTIETDPTLSVSEYARSCRLFEELCRDAQGSLPPSDKELTPGDPEAILSHLSERPLMILNELHTNFSRLDLPTDKDGGESA